MFQESNVKYVVYSSLTIPSNYFNEFIDYLNDTGGEYTKKAVNTMIGCLKPKIRTKWQTVSINTDPNNAFYHFLKNNCVHLDTREINDQRYYQIYKEYQTSRDESESVIYNMVLDLAAIELYKLKSVVEANNGFVLDINTDCIGCVFKDNKLPFNLIDDVNIEGFYFDENQKVPKYKIEHKDERMKIERCPRWIRKQTYEHKLPKWNIYNDVQNNDFTPLINQILDSNQSINIDGPGGTGKSTLIKQLHAK